MNMILRTLGMTKLLKSLVSIDIQRRQNSLSLSLDSGLSCP